MNNMEHIIYSRFFASTNCYDPNDEWYNPIRQNSQFDVFINPNE